MCARGRLASGRVLFGLLFVTLLGGGFSFLFLFRFRSLVLAEGLRLGGDLAARAAAAMA